LLVIPTSTTLVAYEVDTTPPSLTFGDPAPAANAAGWNNTPVDVPFTTAGIQSADPASPLHFTEGANQTKDVTLTHRDGVITVTSPVVNIDMTAPTTSANVTGAGGEWLINAQVTLTPADNLSGVANTFYTLDGGPTQTYTSQFSVTNNGTHTLRFWSVDVAGNTEQNRFSFFKVDNFPPFTSISLGGTVGANNWFRTAVQVSLNGLDSEGSGTASTYYSVDGGATQTYSGAFPIDGEGIHQLNCWSVDNNGNTETPRSLAIKIVRRLELCRAR